MTEPGPLQQIDRTYVRFRQRRLVYFSGCDYFRLASHPEVIAAVERGVREYGLNVAASRLTSGNHVLYGELEARLARFFGSESALLVSSGYLTNLVVAQALAGNFSHALIDENAHASLADAARLLDCPVLQFKSRDAEALAQAAHRCGRQSKLIVLTDGMFPHDGSIAPLAEYLQVLSEDALILVDDAHGAGVLGRRGKGTVERAGVDRRRLIQTVTLSKAFGAYGGAILGPAKLRQRILDRSRMFAGSTPLPLPIVSAALAAVRVLKTDRKMRQRLLLNAAHVKVALREAGLPLAEGCGPIVPMLPRDTNEVSRLRRSLLAAGIYPPFLRYPGRPASGFFRFVISSEHSQSQLDCLLGVLTGFMQRRG
jgi:7-keto-8-aminopelargonate synthetase-like enzyme